MFEKEVYEAPSIEVTEFELVDSIAASGEMKFDLFGNDDVWGS